MTPKKPAELSAQEYFESLFNPSRPNFAPTSREVKAFIAGHEAGFNSRTSEVEELVEAIRKAQNVGEIKFKTCVFSAQVSEEIERVLTKHRASTCETGIG